MSWEDAIKEAKELETKSIEQRNELFNPKKKLEQKTIVKAFEELNERKRKESLAENQVPFKKIKQSVKNIIFNFLINFSNNLLII